MEHQGDAEEATNFVVECGFGDGAALERGEEVFCVHEGGVGHLEVEAAVGCGDAVVGGDPVGHEEAVEAPLLFEDVDVEDFVLGGVLAVDEVVAVHDGADVALLDGGFEGGKVELVEGALVDDGVDVVAIVLGVVGVEVLDGGADALALDAVDVGDVHVGGEVRVFAEVLEVAAVHGRAVDVDAGAEEEVDAAGARVFAES